MRGRWRRGAPRARGEPTSANGASSFHLWWQLPASAPLVEVAATLEVVRAPAVDRLYFWALQVGFHDGHRDRGAAHTGLQWLPSPPGPAVPAVNWGGYRAAQDGGGELVGSPSALPAAGPLENPNTRAYPWHPGQPYRLRVGRAPQAASDPVAAWRATVTDLATGVETVIRDLGTPGPWLATPVVWSEVFARCDDPCVVVRWSDLRAWTDTGLEVAPSTLTVTYQRRPEGGCDNTNAEVGPHGVLQVTATPRTTPHGAVLALPTRAR